jgi:Innexin
MTLVFNNFWVEFFPAIKALLRSDLQEFSKQSAVLFPSQAKCDYFNFGSSGTVQQVDALCLLPQNVVNEKIFVFLYFWMIILFAAYLIHVISTAIKIQHQIRKKRTFGYGLVLSIIKKNICPMLVTDLLKVRNTNDNDLGCCGPALCTGGHTFHVVSSTNV